MRRKLMGKHTKQDSNEIYQERASQARTVRKIVLICLSVIFAIILIGLIGGYTYLSNALKPVDAEGEGNDIEVTIPVNTSTTGIATILEEEGLIRNASLFRYYTRYKNESGFQAGTYTLNTEMDTDQLIEQLKDGRVIAEAASTITIPEGLTLNTVTERLAEFTGTSQEEVFEYIDNQDYVTGLIEEYEMLTDEILNEDIHHPLEGTYFLLAISLKMSSQVLRL